MNTQAFGNTLKKLGYDFYSGVPCSFLKNLINYAINECDYIMAANEGDAVATSSGAHLGGKKTVVLMQNSGLTNAVSPLTSLNYTFKLPILGFVSLRGEEGLNDEPQHELMGKITGQFLTNMNVKWSYLSNDIEVATSQLVEASKIIDLNQPYFFVVKKNTFDEVLLRKQAVTKEIQKKLLVSSVIDIPSRTEALRALVNGSDKNTILLATTGKCGRELFEIEDKETHFYMVGSMGCISSFGLGLALAQPSKKIVVIDGDGAALMRMGNFATNGYYKPNNLFHILLDNNTHDSTGGQSTISNNIDFSLIANASGYPLSVKSGSVEEFQSFFRQWQQEPLATFLHLKISKGSPKTLGRPTIKPFQVKERLINYLKNG